MKVSKKTYILITSIVLLYIFRSVIFQDLVKYDPLKQRRNYTVHDLKLINYIDGYTVNKDLSSIELIIKASNKLTAEKLKFTTSKCDIDPNKLVTTMQTHCVGYTHFFETTCNYLLSKSPLSNTWKAKAYLGKLYVLGIDVHEYFDSPFFKDHDFVIVKNIKTGEIICVDAVVYDYFGIAKVTML